MSINCSNCGIAKRENNKLRCLKYNYLMKPNTPETWRDCNYYIPHMEEDGAVLSPEEHLMLKEVEMQSRGFKGPV